MGTRTRTLTTAPQRMGRPPRGLRKSKASRSWCKLFRYGDRAERTSEASVGGNMQSADRFLVRVEAPLMSNERNSHRTAVMLFAVAVILAILAATVTTLERVDTRSASNV